MEEKNPKCHFRLDCLERALSRAFRRYATWVSLHPWPFIIVPVLLTAALSLGLFHMHVITDAVYLYTPDDGISKYEQRVFEESWPLTDGTFQPGRTLMIKRQCQIIVSSKDNGNVLREPISRAVLRLNDFIMNEIYITDGNERHNYMNLCLKSNRYCYSNPQVTLVSQMYKDPMPYGNLSFPTATFANTRIYLGLTLGGVEVDAVSRQIVSAKAWFLIYQLKFENETDNRLSEMWERELEEVMKDYNDRQLRLSYFHSQTLDIELSKNAAYLIPKMTTMFIGLTIFATVCTLTFIWKKGRFPCIDWTRSTPLLATSGVLGAGMGVVSSVGLLSFLGVPCCEVVGVVPFLVVSVRLDNTFLMVSSLFHTKRSDPVTERISEAISDAAVSITITVLTDVLSFGVGYFTSFPAVQYFCTYTCAAMIITFIYQLTFLLGLLVLHARNEAKGCHVLVPCIKTITVKEAEHRNIFVKLFCTGSGKCDPKSNAIGLNNGKNVFKVSEESDSKGNSNGNCHQMAAEGQTTLSHVDDQEGTWISRAFKNHVAPFLMKPLVKLSILVLYLLYLGTSIYGCVGLREGLEPVNLLVSDSYAIPFYRDLGAYFWHTGVQVQVTFHSPGNMSDSINRHHIHEIVRKFSDSPHGMGAEGLEFWLIEFEHFLPKYNGLQVDDLDEKRFYENLAAFLSFTEFSRFSADVILEYGHQNSTNAHESKEIYVKAVKAFRLMVGITNFSTAVEQTETTTMFREFAADYPEYNITTFHYMWPFVDQYMQILPNVLQEVYSGMACMVLIALLLIPQPLCSVWVSLMIASIDVGVVGYMTLWDLPMDCISMITLVMSIGFSVDFSAHIAYAYTVSKDEHPTDRIRFAIGGLAWPIIQGGLATVLGVLVLAGVNSYMVTAFFKTVLLVIIVGVTHGLIFLPILLNIADVRNLRSLCHSLKAKSSNESVVYQTKCDENTPNQGREDAKRRSMLSRFQKWTKGFLKNNDRDHLGRKPTNVVTVNNPSWYR